MFWCSLIFWCSLDSGEFVIEFRCYVYPIYVYRCVPCTKSTMKQNRQIQFSKCSIFKVCLCNLNSNARKAFCEPRFDQFSVSGGATNSNAESQRKSPSTQTITKIRFTTKLLDALSKKYVPNHRPHFHYRPYRAAALSTKTADPLKQLTHRTSNAWETIQAASIGKAVKLAPRSPYHKSNVNKSRIQVLHTVLRFQKHCW